MPHHEEDASCLIIRSIHERMKYMDIAFKFADAKDDAFTIRRAVFVDEQGFKEEFDAIDEDPRMIHIAVYCDDQLAGCARIFPGDLEPKIACDKDTWVLGRLAVLPEYRTYGLGSKIMVAAEEEAARQGAQKIILHAQCRVQPFYHKLGYAAFGPIEFEEHVEHQWMEKAL